MTSSLRRVARPSCSSLHSSDFLAGDLSSREIRHVARRQGYQDFEGIPTRASDRPRQLIRSRASLRRHRGSLHSVEPFLPWRRWCRTIGQIGRRQRAPASLDPPKRRECLTRVAVRGGKERVPSSLFLPSFPPFFLPLLAPLFRFRVWRNWEASERARKGKERKVGRHRRPLFSSEVGRSGRGNKEVLSSCGCGGIGRSKPESSIV